MYRGSLVVLMALAVFGAIAEVRAGDNVDYIERDLPHDNIGIAFGFDESPFDTSVEEWLTIHTAYQMEDGRRLLGVVAWCGYIEKDEVAMTVFCRIVVKNIGGTSLEYTYEDFALVDDDAVRIQSIDPEDAPPLVAREMMDRVRLPSGQTMEAAVIFNVPVKHTTLPYRIEMLPFESDWTEPLVLIIDRPLADVRTNAS